MTAPLRVLILEDQETDVKLLVSQLRQAGFDVRFVSVDSEEAYVSALREGWDVILADYSMPQFSALRALEILKKKELDIPLIIVTGTVGEETAVEAMRHGASDYLLKDKLTRLGHAIEAVLEQKRAREAKQAADLELQEANLKLKEALEELQRTQAQIIQQERLRALGTMASGIAHDFNNVLSPILGFSELLLDRPENLEDKDKVRRGLEVINTAAKDASKIISRMREFYRHRERADAFQPVDLGRVIDQAVSLTQPKWKDEAQARGATIYVSTDCEPGMQVSGSEAELRELLTNLIFNAVDAMPQGGSMAILARRQGDRAVLQIRDSGCGMSHEVRERCMEPFFTTKGEGGTGLGLSMVAGIVKRHEGTVEIESEVGKGTTFFIRFPLLPPEVSLEEKRNKPHLSPRLSVLLVDDDPRGREVIREYLAGEGHQVEPASNGREALEKFKGGRFDLVITDRGMPELSGDRLALMVKQLVPGLPVILLTGFGDMMKAAGESPSGIDLVLNKPVTLATLREALARVSPRK